MIMRIFLTIIIGILSASTSVLGCQPALPPWGSSVNESAGGNKQLELNPKEVRKLNQQFHFSYKLFQKEFIFTNSIDDYRRSLMRIAKLYDLNIPTASIFKLNKELKDIQQIMLSKMVSTLVLEGRKKANFVENRFYRILDSLVVLSSDFRLGAHIEIEIVNQIRKIEGVQVSTNTSSTGYSSYLLNHARYEVFLYTLYCGQE